MTSGNNTTTISASTDASEMLTSLALHHGLSKVDIASALLLACAALDPEQVDTLISMGHLVDVIIEMGGKTAYPLPMEVGEEMKQLKIFRMLFSPSD